MIRNYFRVIHITVEKTFIWNTLPAHDVMGTSPEGPLKVLTSETYKEPSGNSQGTNTKTDDFMKKMFFRSNYISDVIISLYYISVSVFYRKKKYSKFLNGVVYGTKLRDVHETKWWYVLRTSQGRLWEA